MITYLFGGVKNYDKGLLKVTTLVNNTMQELGMGIKELNLGPPATIPYYDGVKSLQAQDIIENIRASQGVIFATTAGPSGASAVLHTFLEHLEQERDILKDKNCMIIVMSTMGDYGVINYLSRYITNLGGYDSVRMLLDQAFFDRSSNQEIAEKQIEDFYRIIRQKRKFYKPYAGITVNQPGIITVDQPDPMEQVRPYVFPSEAGVTGINVPKAQPNTPQPLIDPSIYDSMPNFKDSYQQQPYVQQNQPIDTKTQNILQNYEALNKNDPQNQGVVYTPSNFNTPQNQPTGTWNNSNLNLNHNQQEDVEDIASFFSKKINLPHTPTGQQTYPQESAAFSPTINPSLPNSPANQWFAADADVAGKKTPRQLTASLIHHYQPQIAGDLSCILQMEVSGAGGFSGYIVIDGANCEYFDGKIENSSLTIISDEANWTNVITGKMSAQKAFMTGTLKIKGNFVLLTRFDQIFNTSKNY